MALTPSLAAGRDNRKYERVTLQLPGQIFNPLDEKAVECRILNLSAGGAALRCDEDFPEGLPLVLYIENFGRFEGTTVAHDNGQLVLEFSIREKKRARLADMLRSFLHNGVAGVKDLRKHAREHTMADNIITLENGKRATYEILDISLEGLSLRTRLRPSLGEIVNLGRIRARVIRHDLEGIAVEYVRESKTAK